MSKACRVLGALTFAIVVTIALLVPWGQGIALEGTTPLVLEHSPQVLGVPIAVATPHGGGVVAPEGEPGPAVLTVDRLPPLAAATQARMEEAYGRLPLHFEANQGQTDGQVQFVARTPGLSLFLTTTEAVLILRQPPTPVRTSGVEERASDPGEPPPPTQHTAPTVLRLHFVGANPAPQVVGLEELPGKSNYFIGNDPTQWRTNIPPYTKVRYREVYPGVNVVYYGNPHQLEYDFIVAPGADPSVITLAMALEEMAGTPRPLPLRVSTDGDVVIQTAGGALRLHRPVVYQEIEGVKHTILCRYVLWPVPEGEGQGEGKEGGTHQVRFHVAAYDRSKPLIIDPVLSYATYLGGSVSDAFVTKLNAVGSALVYSTYLGGSSWDSGVGVAVDPSGNVYVTGLTYSSDFPTTLGAFQTHPSGVCLFPCSAAFIAKS